MKTVWRYRIESKPVQVLNVPQGAQFVKCSGDSLFLLVDTDQPKVPVTIALVRVGVEMPPAKSAQVLAIMKMRLRDCAVVRLDEPDPAALAAFETAQKLVQKAFQQAIKDAVSEAVEDDQDDEPGEDD